MSSAEFYVTATVKIIMIVVAIALIPVARKEFKKKRYPVGILLVATIACLLLFKFTFVFD